MLQDRSGNRSIKIKVSSRCSYVTMTGILRDHHRGARSRCLRYGSSTAESQGPQACSALQTRRRRLGAWLSPKADDSVFKAQGQAAATVDAGPIRRRLKRGWQSEHRTVPPLIRRRLNTTAKTMPTTFGLGSPTAARHTTALQAWEAPSLRICVGCELAMRQQARPRRRKGRGSEP